MSRKSVNRSLYTSVQWQRRRKFLCRSTPICPKCGEKEQIQLVYWLGKPADWKCRECKHEFKFEPKNSPPLPPIGIGRTHVVRQS